MPVLVVAGPITAAEDVGALCDKLRAVIANSAARTVVCDVGALPATCGTVEALARLQLTARRAGRRVRLQRTSPELERFLHFAGLAEALGARALVVERERHAEQREEPRDVEEAVDRDDPPV